jgi:hypothetical protein
MSASGNAKCKYEVLSYLNGRKDIETVKLEARQVKKSRVKAQLDAATSIQSSEAVT